MPELPEVQTIVDALTKNRIIGQRINRAIVFWPKTIATSTTQAFCSMVHQKTICSLHRRGKFIIFGLEGGCHLAVHLRMTGRFELSRDGACKGPHIHVVFELSDGRCLKFHDTRKFGRFYLTRDLSTITGNLGPEPLSPKFTARVFAERLKEKKRRIKPLLLDQGFLSGLGNIYVDEALWAAGIHPLRRSNSLNWSEIKSLHKTVRSVLRQGIRNAGTSLGSGLGNYSGIEKTQGKNRDFLKVFRRTGMPCYRCGDPIRRILVGQRGTHICKVCQR